MLKVCLAGYSSIDQPPPETYCYGLARLAAYPGLKEIDASIRILNRYAGADPSREYELIRSMKPDVIGFSTYIWNIELVRKLVSRLRESLPGTLIAAGGPAAEWFRALPPDGAGPHCVVIGDGEEEFARLLSAFGRGGIEAAAPQPGERPQVMQSCLPAGELDVIGSPYVSGIFKPLTNMTYWEMSRGCPYRCSFCLSGSRSGKLRYFSADFLAREVRWMKNNGLTRVNMCDSAVNNNTARLDEFTAMLAAEDPERQLKFTFAIHSDHINERQVSMLSRIDIERAAVGLNSLTPETFDTVGRKIDPARFRRSMELLGAVARPAVSIILGLPGETPRGFRRTLDFCASLDALTVIYELKVFPGIRYFEKASEYGVAYDPHDTMNIIETPSFSRDELNEMRRIAAGYAGKYGNIVLGDVKQA